MTGASGDLRPIHYMGNKSRFLDGIQAAVDSVAQPGSAACDLFAGSGVVSRRLAQTRPVISTDIQAYSRVLAAALTAPRRLTGQELERIFGVAQDWFEAASAGLRPLLEIEDAALSAVETSPQSLAELIERGALVVEGGESSGLKEAKDRAREVLDPIESTMTWYYGGAYFAIRQALELDALRHAFRVLWGPQRDPTAVAALLGVASDVASSVGNHFAQPIQPRRTDGSLKRSWTIAASRTRCRSVMAAFESWVARYALLEPTPHPCVAVQADFRETLCGLSPDVGVIYADPPYTRDHYSRFYHVLETIALDDDPGVTSTTAASLAPSRGLYRTSRHQSPFSIRSQVAAAFQEVFGHAKRLGVPLVLSYSPMSEGTRARPQTRLMSVQQLVSMAETYFSDVDLVDVTASTHSRFNRVELSAAVEGAAEVLIVASP